MNGNSPGTSDSNLPRTKFLLHTDLGLTVLARERIEEGRCAILAGEIEPKSLAAWTTLFDVAEAAAVHLADRSASLHALAYVVALGPANPDNSCPRFHEARWLGRRRAVA